MTEKIGILLYENVQPMDVIGPWEVFSFWKNTLNADVDLYLVAEKQGLVQCDNGITLKAHCDFAHCPPLDYLIVPGGRGRLKEVENAVLIDFIKQQSQHSKYLISVCTGAFLVQKAGLLEGKTATTYWRALPELKAFKELKVKEERVVKDGKLWMSGGVSSGIDLALELIAEIAGQETAGKVQLLFEYFPRDTVYSTPEMINDLPSYGHTQNATVLPDYIKKYLSGKKK